jgi:alpha-L-rhamnosidase
MLWSETILRDTVFQGDVLEMIKRPVRIHRAISFVLLAFSSVVSSSQNPNSPDQPNRQWHASWISHPTAPLREPVVLHFRRMLMLTAVPGNYVVRVSADNRFVLFVNGHRVGDGPARGDVAHWRYERFDLAPLLKRGENLITATVWNFGIDAPIAQMSDRTAFLLESEAAGEQSISTPNGWQVETEKGQRAIPQGVGDFGVQMLSGPGEEVNAALYDWAWNSPTVMGGSWVPAAPPIREWISPAASQAKSADADRNNSWGLVPDTLPAMEYIPTEPGEVVRTELPNLRGFPASPVTVPGNTHVHLLLDRKTLTTAYPMLTVSGGKDAQIRLVYAEALYDKEGHKGDRDDVGDRKILGITDRFLPDGGAHRSFEPLWWRTWRYLDLDIQTGAEPLHLESLQAWFTAYPFHEQASFQTNDSILDRIWEISWRTFRIGSHETYVDSPYYEQLQYVGDTRIEALISYAVTGDDRLARQAITAFDESRSSDGLTRSRYPSSLPQTIPPFSLLWIGMVHDYWMYRPDAVQVRRWLPGTRTVLDWFAGQEESDGLLHRLPWWSFVDWVAAGEIPTYDSHGESCTTTLEYLGALNDAVDLENTLGDPQLATHYHARAVHVRDGLIRRCWDASRGLIADNPDLKNFSQQSNILAVLYDVVPPGRQQEVLRRILVIRPGEIRADGILSASYYFRFYLARAMEHAGLADDYLSSLDPWRELLSLHFSTWPETPGNTRSDSHAWTAHPIYDLLTLVAGIEPATPGFTTVRIAPHLGTLPSLTAAYPHPEGLIQVKYSRHDSSLDAVIVLPGKLTGTFLFNRRSQPLHAGENRLTVPDSR